jgi:hypothetical protein
MSVDDVTDGHKLLLNSLAARTTKSRTSGIHASRRNCEASASTQTPTRSLALLQQITTTAQA